MAHTSLVDVIDSVTKQALRAFPQLTVDDSRVEIRLPAPLPANAKEWDWFMKELEDELVMRGNGLHVQEGSRTRGIVIVYLALGPRPTLAKDRDVY